jgi:hypothetical protein
MPKEDVLKVYLAICFLSQTTLTSRFVPSRETLMQPNDARMTKLDGR